MSPPGRIILIGFMGSGKSVVGRLLASRLGYRFVDTDALVVEREGASIARIFAEKGEKAFRAAESAVLRDLASREGIVVATGGGAPAQPGNAWFFAGGKDAVVVHLRVSLEVARERTHGDKGRPLLGRGEAEVKKLYDARLPLYESLGRGVDTDSRSAESVAEEISRILDSPTGHPPAAGSA